MNEFNPDWKLSIEDIDKYAFIIKEHLSNKIIESIVDTKEQALRVKLISLGWTPPEEAQC